MEYVDSHEKEYKLDMDKERPKLWYLNKNRMIEYCDVILKDTS
jgi:hypothetical protein